jgi:sulfoxide reductase heme-binding subunit YedZ
MVWALSLLPLAWLGWGAFTDGLGTNPVDVITDQTGTWALVFLLASLAVTPVRRLTGWNRVIRLRRLLGLFAFFYASLHFGAYLWLDQFFAWGYILEDVLERPFITAGFAAYLLLVPLAVTSTTGMIRRLGGKRWRRLHWLVYLIAVLSVVHFLWLAEAKSDIRDPLLFAAVLVLLLGLRLPFPRASRR